MLLSASTRGWMVAYLAVALACTITWLLLDQRLAEQTGLRRQVWLTGDSEGAPFINDVSSGATLDFLDDYAAMWIDGELRLNEHPNRSADPPSVHPGPRS